MVESGHGQTYPSPTPSERRRTGATLPGGQRAQRAHLVAASLAARPGAHGDGTFGGHGLPSILDRSNCQALQRTGTRRHAESPAYHVVSTASGVVARAAGGAARGAGGSRGAERALDRRGRGRRVGTPPPAPDFPLLMRELPPAPDAEHCWGPGPPPLCSRPPPNQPFENHAYRLSAD